MSLELTSDQVIKLLREVDGPQIAVRVSLVRRLGLSAAVFVSQCAFLSMNASMSDGFFFLAQQGDGDFSTQNPDDDGETGLYRRLGSWRKCTGLSKDEQQAIRARLVKAMLAAELESPSQLRRSESQGKAKPLPSAAFLFFQRRGTPPRLYYRIDPLKYFLWLTQPSENSEQTEIAAFEGGNSNRSKAVIQNVQKPENSANNNKRNNEKKRIEKPPQPSRGALQIFLDALTTEVKQLLADRVSDLKKDLRDASEQQCQLAAAALVSFVATGKADDPIALARGLCQKAARGNMKAPAVGVKTAHAKQQLDEDTVCAAIRARSMIGRRFFGKVNAGARESSLFSFCMDERILITSTAGETKASVKFYSKDCNDICRALDLGQLSEIYDEEDEEEAA